jgi:hypothetical protein
MHGIEAIELMLNHSWEVYENQLDNDNTLGAAHARSLNAMAELIMSGGEYSRDPIVTDDDYHYGSYSQAIRTGVSGLIEAIGLYVRSDADTHARYLSDIADDALDRVQNNEGRPIVVGLCDEWRGDVQSMISPESAPTYYERAKERYKNVDSSEFIGWGSEPESTTALSAYTEYIRAQGLDDVYEAADDALQIKFIERIDFKLDVVEQLTSD